MVDNVASRVSKLDSAMMNPEEAERKRRHVWQCRRGIKEVEFVLHAYLERFYDEDSRVNREHFARLLECEDTELFEWFTRRARPEDADLELFIDDVLKRIARSG
jgi:antitoxin CptB